MLCFVFVSELPFSRRHGMAGPQAGILIREEAPVAVRVKLFDVLSSLTLPSFGDNFDSARLRSLVCQVLNIQPNLEQWPWGIWNETEKLIYECEWFHFYEIVEELYRRLRKEDGLGTALVRVPQKGVLFATAMNEAFVRQGIAWQLVDGRVVLRGDEA